MPGCFHANWCQWVSHPLAHHLNGRRRRSPTFSNKGFWNGMGGRKSESLHETIWNSSLLLTVRPVPISMACPDSCDQSYLHRAARHWSTARTRCLFWSFPALFCGGECLLDVQCYLCLCWEASESSQQWGSVSWEAPPWNAVNITGSCLGHF